MQDRCSWKSTSVFAMALWQMGNFLPYHLLAYLCRAILVSFFNKAQSCWPPLFFCRKRSWVSEKLNITAKLLQQGQSWAEAGDSPEQSVAPCGPDAAALLGSALLINLPCGTLCCHAFLTLLHVAVIPSAIQMEGSTTWAALATRWGMQPLKTNAFSPATHTLTQTYTLSHALYSESTIFAKEKRAGPDWFAIKISTTFLLLLELSREV